MVIYQLLSQISMANIKNLLDIEQDRYSQKEKIEEYKYIRCKLSGYENIPVYEYKLTKTKPHGKEYIIDGLENYTKIVHFFNWLHTNIKIETQNYLLGQELTDDLCFNSKYTTLKGNNLLMYANDTISSVRKVGDLLLIDEPQSSPPNNGLYYSVEYKNVVLAYIDGEKQIHHQIVGVYDIPKVLKEIKVIRHNIIGTGGMPEVIDRNINNYKNEILKLSAIQETIKLRNQKMLAAIKILSKEGYKVSIKNDSTMSYTTFIYLYKKTHVLQIRFTNSLVIQQNYLASVKTICLATNVTTEHWNMFGAKVTKLYLKQEYVTVIKMITHKIKELK